jgi:hypothetical protein
MHLTLSLSLYVNVYTYVCIYIYRKRERVRCVYIYMYMLFLCPEPYQQMPIYIYIYILYVPIQDQIILTPPETAFNDDFYAADAWSEHADFPTEADPVAMVIEGDELPAEPGVDSDSESDSDVNADAEPIDEMANESDEAREPIHIYICTCIYTYIYICRCI